MASFYDDVIRNDPYFNSLARVFDVRLLEPVTRSAVRAIINDAKLWGIDLMVFETYRSRARQVQLFNQGASQLRVVGVHHYGLACDIVKVTRGRPSWDGDFSFLGDLARQHGLVWGGDWGSPGMSHSFIDAVHVQRCTVDMQTALFAGNWYPDSSYDPFRSPGAVQSV